MLLRFRDGGRIGDLKIDVQDPRATIAQLLEALGFPNARRAYLDGREIDPRQPLSRFPVPDGAVLSLQPTMPAKPPTGPVIKVAEGIDSGQAVPLSSGTVSVGRAGDNALVVEDPTVSRYHCQVVANGSGLVVVDASSHNGTFVDGRRVEHGHAARVDGRSRITNGNTGLRLADWGAVDRPVAIEQRAVVDGGRVFHRQPPTWPNRRSRTLVVPQPPAEPTKPLFTVTALLLPILMGLFFFLGPRLMHQSASMNPMFLLFIALSPLMMVGNAFEQRMRGRRRFGSESRSYRDEVARFRDQLSECCADESEFRTDAHPDIAEIVRWATLPSARLWERRRDHPSFADLVIGTGDVPWCPQLDGGDPIDEVADAIDEIGHLFAVPLVFDAEPGHVLGLTGPREHALAIARSMVIQAAAAHGPADIAIAAVVSHPFAKEWDWIKWLPHTATSTGVRTVACGDDAASRVAKEIADDAGDRTVLVLVDAGDDADLGNRWARDLFDGSLRVAGIVVASNRGSLPPTCDPVVTWDDATQSLLVWPRAGRAVRAAPLGVKRSTAEACATSMASLRDPFQNAGTSTIPRRCSLIDMLGQTDRLSTAITDRWASPDGGSTLRVPLGVGAAGEVSIDLRAETGVAILGASGSGRTETLRVLVTGAASSADPDHVMIVLVGRGLATCDALPHVLASCEESDGETLAAVCESIERLLTTRRQAGAAPLTVLVAIDDLQTLHALQNAQTERLFRLSRATGSAVVRILAASARPTGPLNWLSEAGATRIALRTDNAGDAREWVNDAAPASFGRDRPGAAMLVAPAAAIVQVQIASLAYDSRQGSTPFEVTRFDLATAGAGRRSESEVNGRDLARLADAIAEAASLKGFSPRRIVHHDDDGAVEAPALDLGALLGIDVGTLDPASSWAPRSRHDFLRVPFGTDLTGGIVELDLKEAAHQGMGPHGLVVGATGSGKSELLRTLLMALAVTHPPTDLAFVLVDFKGGATFRGMAGLPQLSGLVTNLTGESALVDRVREAIKGELALRQQVIHDANVDSITEYAEQRRLDSGLAPLPHLLLVIDEFVELLTEEPGFVEVFNQIGRVGRSIGVHLLLASQQLEESKIRGLERNLRYRIALRTETAAESRVVLNQPDAVSLPPDPGSGYLKVDVSPLQRFRAAYASGPYGPEDDTGRTPTTMAVIVERLAGGAERARQIWLPPLPPMVPLTWLLSDWTTTPERGLHARSWASVAPLCIPIGLEDRPSEQRQPRYVVNFGGAQGNLVVVGSARTGKSMTIRTIAMALACTHTPLEVQIYAIDLGGGTLHPLAGLPHVGAVAGPRDEELTRRVIGHVETLLAEREELFRKNSIDSMATFRTMRRDGLLPDEVYGDVFLVVDGWMKFRQDYEAYEQSITDLATRGLGYGIHVLLTANRWGEVKSALADQIGGVLELKLNNHTESQINGREALALPKDVPGRALTREHRYVHIAAPRLDDDVSSDTLARASELSISAIADAWPQAGAPPVRTLPTSLRLSDLTLPQPLPPGVLVGLSEQTMGPEYVDLVNGDPHFLVYGDNEVGKSTFLRTFVRGLVRRTTPDETAVYVVDVRRSLLEVVPDGYLRSYIPNATAAVDVFAQLKTELEQRLPGSDVTAAELRARSWWSGPEVYVVVDDYDMLTGNPLGPLIDFFAQGRDIGLHVLVARRVSGASGAAFDPAIKRLREVSPTGLILSGDRSEGVLIGAYRAGPQPPGRGLLVRPRALASTIQVLVDEGEDPSSSETAGGPVGDTVVTDRTS